jgi:hypothetical protein
VGADHPEEIPERKEPRRLRVGTQRLGDRARDVRRMAQGYAQTLLDRDQDPTEEVVLEPAVLALGAPESSGVAPCRPPAAAEPAPHRREQLSRVPEIARVDERLAGSSPGEGGGGRRSVICQADPAGRGRRCP